MKRRELLTAAITSGLAVPAMAAQGGHDHKPITGPLANATVSFGFWRVAGEVAGTGNRFATPNAPAQPNGHALLPYESTIKAGGTVNFIVAGLHLIAVYEPGKTVENVDITSLVPNSAPPLIDDPVGRIYFGLDPRRMPLLLNTPAPPPPLLQDRVEVVQFHEPGRYLVICAVLPHFAPNPPVHPPMHGWVRVLP